MRVFTPSRQGTRQPALSYSSSASTQRHHSSSPASPPLLTTLSQAHLLATDGLQIASTPLTRPALVLSASEKLTGVRRRLCLSNYLVGGREGEEERGGIDIKRWLYGWSWGHAGKANSFPATLIVMGTAGQKNKREPSRPSHKSLFTPLWLRSVKHRFVLGAAPSRPTSPFSPVSLRLHREQLPPWAAPRRSLLPSALPRHQRAPGISPSP